MKTRPERFGAWARVDDGTLVAVDRVLARRLGIDGGALWDDAVPAPDPWPLEVHVAVTSRCPAGCGGCYQSATRDGEDVPLAVLTERLDALAARGVFTVAFGGGEPLLRDDLGELARLARARGMVPVVTTSGLGMTREKAEALRDFAQVNVSHDGVAGGYAAVRGFAGESMADRAVRLLAEAGVAVGVNHVLTRQNVDGLAATARHARSLGAREMQLLRYKPAGRAASPEYLARRLTREQVAALGDAVRAVAAEHEGALSVRVDCAMVPLLSGALDDAAALARFGVFGCEAGRHLAALRRDGAVAGCSFGAGVSARGGVEAWAEDEALAALRRYAEAPPEPCASCGLRPVCRGGCRIVSEHLTGAWAPDPECPRVIAARERG
ncbi:MAG: radical SAM protein [Polyangiales bacterium]